MTDHITITVLCDDCHRSIRRHAHERGNPTTCWECEFGVDRDDPVVREGAFHERRATRRWSAAMRKPFAPIVYVERERGDM